MRALAQSLAREFGPKGVHVVHAIIDGVIDIERTKDWKFEHEDAKIKPEAVSTILRPVTTLPVADEAIQDCGNIFSRSFPGQDVLHASTPCLAASNPSSQEYH